MNNNKEIYIMIATCASLNKTQFFPCTDLWFCKAMKPNECGYIKQYNLLTEPYNWILKDFKEEYLRKAIRMLESLREIGI